MMKLIMFLFFLLFIYKLNYFMKLIIQNYIFLYTLIMILNFNLYNFYWSKLYYIFSMDNISFNLIMLTCWILSISLLSSNKIIFSKFNNNFISLIIFMMIIFMLYFTSMNLMMFYIYFESSLIPIMLMILGWGTQINRIQASMYMLFYTLFGSLPLLMMIIYLFNKYNFIMMNLLILNLNSMNNIYMYMMMIMAFLIKMPMYFIHLWLPKAHVEAPISGSMILASIMLKLGSYGLFRLMNMFPLMFLNFNYLIIMISIMGGVFASLICLNQMDMKIIVAYSSIVHMSILMASMMTMFNWGYSGSFLMMIAHGLSSSGMFCLVNLNYERIYSRNLLINKGLLNLFPSLTMWWFLICSSNFSAPPSLNLLSEIMLWNSLISWFNFMMIILILISFFSTCYSIYIFSYSQYGTLSFNLKKIKFINSREFIILFLHWIPLNLLFMNLNIFI